MFKVGDKVKFLETAPEELVGITGTLTGWAKDGDPFVVIDNLHGSIFWAKFNLEDLRPIEDKMDNYRFIEVAALKKLSQRFSESRAMMNLET